MCKQEKKPKQSKRRAEEECSDEESEETTKPRREVSGQGVHRRLGAAAASSAEAFGVKQYREIVKTEGILKDAAQLLALAATSTSCVTVSATELRSVREKLSKRLTPQLMQLHGKHFDGFKLNDPDDRSVITGESLQRRGLQLASAQDVIQRLDGAIEVVTLCQPQKKNKSGAQDGDASSNYVEVRNVIQLSTLKGFTPPPAAHKLYATRLAWRAVVASQPEAFWR